MKPTGIAEKKDDFRRVLNQLAEAALEIDDKGRILYANPAAADFLGKNAKTLMGMDFFSFFDLDLSEKIRLFIESSKLSPPSEPRIVSLAHRTVAVRSVSLTAQDANTTLVVLSDLSASQRSENALAASEAKFNAVMDSAADAIITIDSSGVILNFNRAAEEIFGYDAGAMIGSKVNTLMPSPHRDRHDDYIARYCKTGISKVLGKSRELTGRRRDGSEFPMELSLSEVNAGTERSFTGIIRDITARKAAEAREAALHAQTRKSHKDLLTILDMLDIGVMAVDRKGRIGFANQKARWMSCRPGETIIGQSWPEVFRLDKEGIDEVDRMCGKPPAKRCRIPLFIEPESGSRRFVEMEIIDDPRDATRSLFLLYDLSEVHDLRRQLTGQARFHDMVGRSSPMQTLYRRIRDVADLDWTVLIQGETGTGKDLVARAIHYSGKRSSKPFVVVNCAGLTDSLLSSELFGHRRGAFTGAVEDRMGLFEKAQGGTLFLDEIGDISPTLQATLLRVIEEKTITRLGETTPRKIDVRIIAATLRDLVAAVARSRFRPDLLYRLRVARMDLPPLRERREDIPLLAGSFLDQARAATGKNVSDIDQDALRALLEYPWPGNVRELKTAMEYATLHSLEQIIRVEDLPAEITQPPPASTSPAGSASPADSVTSNLANGLSEADEKAQIVEALERARGKKTAAARLLGMSRSTFYRRLEAFGLMKNR